jgi:hypothetical protein
MAYYVDFVGLNTFIYEPVGWDPDNQAGKIVDNTYPNFERVNSSGFLFPVSQNTIGLEMPYALSSRWTLIKKKNEAFTIYNADLPTTASFFPALMLKRNGPYGFPIWKQTRISHNPLTRRQVKENVFTFVEEPGPEFIFNSNGKLNIQRSRYGAIKKFNENPVSSRYKPFKVGAASIIEDGTLERFELLGTYGNETIFFNNKEINKYNDLRVQRSAQYNTIKDFYLNGGLDKDGSPLDTFEYFNYRECVYPPRVYQYKNYTRQRTTFSFPWRDKRSNRTETNSNDGFVSKGIFTSVYDSVLQSIWPLDANVDFPAAFITGSEDRMYYYGRPIAPKIKDFGVLQNTWNSFSPGAVDGANPSDGLFGPLYARKHMLPYVKSCVSKNGMKIEGVLTSSFGDIPYSHLPCGEVKWEAGSQSGLNPFYDTYDNYIQDVRQHGKDYSIIPEFRISEHVEAYTTEGLTKEVSNLFSLTGALEDTTDSSKDNFYKIYSTSEFMKHFEVVKKDHKGFVPANSLKLKCKAVKKFLPYEGFYPVQRTIDMAKQFVNSYSDSVISKRNGIDELFKNNRGFQNLMLPTFAPGVLYNSIKSGIACDYPIINDNIPSVLQALPAQGYLIMNRPAAGGTSTTSDMPNNNGLSVRYGNWVFGGVSGGGTGDSDGDGFNAFAIQLPSGSINDIGEPGYDSLRTFRIVQSGAYGGGISNGDAINTSNFPNGYVRAVVVNATASWDDVTQAISSSIAVALSGTITSTIDEFGVKLSQAPGLVGNISEIPDIGFEVNPAIIASTAWLNQISPAQMSVEVFKGGTDAVYALNNSSSAGLTSGSIFDQRIPFEAIVEPEKYLTDNTIYYNEPHPSGNYGGLCIWDGTGDNLYKLMANNFTAEVSSFFLKNGNSSIQSLPSNNPDVGNAVAGRKYRMRVKIFKTSAARTPTRPQSSTSTSDLYYTPQYAFGEYETFTMYSRPSAFGPECMLYNESDSLVNNPSEGDNYPFTPPYYYGESWADILFEPTESKKYSIEEIIATSSVEYYRYLEDGTTIGQLPSDDDSQIGNQFLNTVMNKNAMQLDASLNIFSQLKEPASSGEVATNTNNVPSRWAIQTKFETPMLNFNHLTASNSVTLPTEGSASTARGMWHQYGLIETDPHKGIFMQVTNVPNNFRKQLLNEDLEDQYSLASLCGFSSDPIKLGQIADQKKVYEAVIAVPFIEKEGDRMFFRIPRIDIQRAFGTAADRALVGDSVLKMIAKMQRYVFPPTMDFLKNDTIDPFAMYVFEFSHTLKKQDLANIWQNLYPEIGQTFETAESSISHELLAHELLGGGAVVTPEGTLDVNAVGNEIPDRVRWMVFKVKQRAEINYYNNIIGRQDDLPEASVSSEGANVQVSYNWPYDFFSLVELAKIETEVKFAERAIKTGQEPRSTIVPKARQKIVDPITGEINQAAVDGAYELDETIRIQSTQTGNIQGAGLSLNQKQLDTPFATVGSTGIDLRVADAQGNLAGSLGNQVNEMATNVAQGMGPAGSVGTEVQELQNNFANSFVSSNNFFGGY